MSSTKLSSKRFSKKSLKSLKGVLKGTGISSDEVKEMRQREENAE